MGKSLPYVEIHPKIEKESTNGILTFAEKRFIIGTPK
jgi:hypothetical protein